MIVSISGGIGNQMFQYAFAKSLASLNNIKVKLDVSFYENQDLRKFELNNFNTTFEIATRYECEKLRFSPSILKPISSIPFIRRFGERKMIREDSFNYSSKYFNVRKPTYFEGYWQSPKYFESIRSQLYKDFSLKNTPSKAFEKSSKLMSNSETISVHVRRGDYVSNANTSSFHGICSMDYYHKAIHLMKDGFSDPLYVFFSDDLDWVKSNFKLDNSMFVEGMSDIEQLLLMSRADRNIIANSSYSWWGAWLNSKIEKKVCAPLKWFNDTSIKVDDLFEKDWVKI